MLKSHRNNRQREPNLVLTEMHGKSEPLSTAFRKSLEQDRAPGWDVEKANREAFDAGLRQVKHNLAMMFADAAINAAHPDYELRRPAQLLELAKNRNYVIDVHDLPLDNRVDFVAIGSNSDVQRMLGIAALLGICNVVVYHDNKRIASHVPHAVTIELGRGENDELIGQNVARLRACIGRVALGEVPRINTDDFNFFQRVNELSVSQAKVLGLQNMLRIEPFGTLPIEVLQRLRRDITLPAGSYVADYWNSQSSSPDKWFGSILRRIQNPFPALAVDEPRVLQSTLSQRSGMQEGILLSNDF